MSDVKKLKEEIKYLKTQNKNIISRLEELEGGINLDKEFYSYKDVANLARKTVRTIRMHEKGGRIKAKFPTSVKKFDRKTVIKYLRGR
ncbi:hypothetical protein [Candidatus Uabimicrobium sp. HlEnr_7]|uniref:hypothetical protein n=1 Tax=Candidatus Uabimicrobium helgolandensis TaxID=3095367 RepID=UPI0035585C46